MKWKSLLPSSLLLTSFLIAATAMAADHPPSDRTSAVQAMTQAMFANPERPDLQALARDFPEVADQIKAEIVKSASEFASLTPEQAYAAGFRKGSHAFGEWQQRYLHTVAVTSDDAASTLYADKLAILEHLAKTNEAQCAIFSKTRSMRGLAPKDTALRKLATLQLAHAVSAVKIAMVTPNNEMPIDGDFGAMADQIAALDREGRLANLILNGGLENASDADNCHAAILFTRGALNLSGAQRGRMIRSFLAGEFP